MADTASSTMLQWELAHFENCAVTLFGGTKSLNLGSYVLLELRVKRFVSTRMSRVACTYHFALFSIKWCEKEPSTFLSFQHCVL